MLTGLGKRLVFRSGQDVLFFPLAHTHTRALSLSLNLSLARSLCTLGIYRSIVVVSVSPGLVERVGKGRNSRTDLALGVQQPWARLVQGLLRSTG